MASHNKPFVPSISWLMNLMEQLYSTFKFWSVRLPSVALKREYDANLRMLGNLVMAYVFLVKFLKDWLDKIPDEVYGSAFIKRFNRIKLLSKDMLERFSNLRNRSKGIFD